MTLFVQIEWLFIGYFLCFVQLKSTKNTEKKGGFYIWLEAITIFEFKDS